MKKFSLFFISIIFLSCEFILYDLVKEEKPTLTEKDHVVNLLKLLVKEDINIENISYKRNALNNIVATYLKENTVKNTGKVINGVLKILEKEK